MSHSSLDFRPAKIKQSVRTFVFNFHGAQYLNYLLSRGEPGFCSLLSRFVDILLDTLNMDLRLACAQPTTSSALEKTNIIKSYKLHFLIRYTTSRFEVKEPTTLYHHYHHRHLPHSPSLLLICHTHTDATVYTISNLPYFHIPHHGPILTKSVLDALTSLCTALASAVYTLCHLPIKPTIIHILISISHSAGPNTV